MHSPAATLALIVGVTAVDPMIARNDEPPPASVVTAAAVVATQVPAASATADSTVIAFAGPGGEVVGEATLLDAGPSGVLIRLRLHGLTPGPHAVHIHETGRCEGPDFTSAGGHMSPDERRHGLLSESGPHAGDLPNLFLDGDGPWRAELLATRVTLGDGPASLAEGASLVIHEGADDHRSDPAGAAGARVACAVIASGG